MSVPFDFFFGILGLVAGMVIVWLLESRHAFEPNEEPWTLPDPVEPAFIAAEMTRRGHPVDEDTVAEVLDIHLAYLDGRATDEEARSGRIALARARRELRVQSGAERAGEATAAGDQIDPLAAPAEVGPAEVVEPAPEPAQVVDPAEEPVAADEVAGSPRD